MLADSLHRVSAEVTSLVFVLTLFLASHDCGNNPLIAIYVVREVEIVEQEALNLDH